MTHKDEAKIKDLLLERTRRLVSLLEVDAPKTVVSKELSLINEAYRLYVKKVEIKKRNEKDSKT